MSKIVTVGDLRKFISSPKVKALKDTDTCYVDPGTFGELYHLGSKVMTAMDSTSRPFICFTIRTWMNRGLDNDSNIQFKRTSKSKYYT